MVAAFWTLHLVLPQEDHVSDRSRRLAQATTEADPLADPEVGFVTPTQAGTLVAALQAAQQHTQHQGAAHQVHFNLDDGPTDLGPVHVYYSDLGEPYDPAAAETEPPPAPLIAAAVHDCFEDSASSSDDDATMDDDLSFVKGSATHGDVHDFSYRMLRLIRGGRKAAYRLPDQLQAWAVRCDKTTDRAVQTAIATGFVLAVGGGGGCRQAILH